MYVNACHRFQRLMPVMVGFRIVENILQFILGNNEIQISRKMSDVSFWENFHNFLVVFRKPLIPLNCCSSPVDDKTIPQLIKSRLCFEYIKEAPAWFIEVVIIKVLGERNLRCWFNRKNFIYAYKDSLSLFRPEKRDEIVAIVEIGSS